MTKRNKLIISIAGLIGVIIMSILSIFFILLGVYILGAIAPWAIISAVYGVFPMKDLEPTLVSILIGILMMACGFATLRCVKPISKEFQDFLNDK